MQQYTWTITPIDTTCSQNTSTLPTMCAIPSINVAVNLHQGCSSTSDTVLFISGNTKPINNQLSAQLKPIKQTHTWETALYDQKHVYNVHLYEFTSHSWSKQNKSRVFMYCTESKTMLPMFMLWLFTQKTTTTKTKQSINKIFFGHQMLL